MALSVGHPLYTIKRVFVALSVLSVLSVFVLPISADLPIPGTRSILVSNYVGNIGDFPDYRFMYAVRMGSNFNDIGFLEEDGLIPPVYKYFTSSVFAVPMAAINISDERVLEMSTAEFSGFLELTGAKEVARGISNPDYVSSASIVESVTNYYDVDLERTLEGPTRRVVTYNGLPYVYAVLSVVGLVGIVAILVRRRRK